MKIITDKEKKNFKKRFDKIEPKIPRSYVPVMEFLFPGKYTKGQLRDFKSQKTYNFDILEDFEKIMKFIQQYS